LLQIPELLDLLPDAKVATLEEVCVAQMQLGALTGWLALHGTKNKGYTADMPTWMCVSQGLLRLILYGLFAIAVQACSEATVLTLQFCAGAWLPTGAEAY
jgi:hypothetical protein